MRQKYRWQETVFNKEEYNIVEVMEWKVHAIFNSATKSNLLSNNKYEYAHSNH